MTARIEKSILRGEVTAPPSKSMSHRMLILAALSGGRCKVENLDYSEDVLAMLDCLEALGAKYTKIDSTVIIDGTDFLENVSPTLNCRESGNTLRFMIPLCLTTGKRITLNGSKRLMERPQSVYEEICRHNGFLYEKGDSCVTVQGNIGSRFERYSHTYIDGSVSSQFITGMIFALLSLKGEHYIYIEEPFESRSYVELTISAVKEFGGDVRLCDNDIYIVGKSLKPRDVVVEGDYSNAAFLDAFNCIGGNVNVKGLSLKSAQGDRVYKYHFAALMNGCPTIDISDCPDLGPIYIALGAMLSGSKLTGTRRLAMKESDRGAAMQEELINFGLEIEVKSNEIIVPKRELMRPLTPLYGHNDHRIVMALAVMCSVLGGEIEGAEAVRKTFPNFFDVIKGLGANVELI